MPIPYKAPQASTLSLADVLSDLEALKAAPKATTAAEDAVDYSRRIESFLALSPEQHGSDAILKASYAQVRLVTALAEASEGSKLDATGTRVESVQRKIGEVQRSVASSLARVQS
jgi:hypothetical protein